jgi:hypothetical protein
VQPKELVRFVSSKKSKINQERKQNKTRREERKEGSEQGMEDRIFDKKTRRRLVSDVSWGKTTTRITNRSPMTCDVTTQMLSKTQNGERRKINLAHATAATQLQRFRAEPKNKTSSACVGCERSKRESKVTAKSPDTRREEGNHHQEGGPVSSRKSVTRAAAWYQSAGGRSRIGTPKPHLTRCRGRIASKFELE